MMGKQNIAIRGHVPCNSILRDHQEHARPTAKYTSPEIQNELLDIAAFQILNSIVVDCTRAQCFAFIADESTDVE